MTQTKRRLLTLLTNLSYSRGITKLASGRTSDFYIDCKQTALHAEGAHLIGTLIFEHVRQLRGQGLLIEGVGGLTLGADPLAVACAAYSFAASEPVHAFIIRKEPKAHGTAAYLEGAKNFGPDAHVLLLEDVVTTGQSAHKAFARASDSGLVPAAILALVDREEGGREHLLKLGLPFTSLFTRRDFVDAGAAPATR